MVRSPTLTSKSNLMSKELIENSILKHFNYMITQHKHLLMDLKCLDRLMTI